MKTKKKSRPVSKRTIVAIVGVSVLAGSCNIDDSEYNNDDNIYGKITKSSDIGKQLLNIETLKLTDDFTKYTEIIRHLLSDVSKNEESAALFCSAPEAYLTQHKFKEKYDVDLRLYLTERDKNLLLAFTDSEIQLAVKNDDLRQFIRLCDSKGFLSSPSTAVSKGYTDYSRFFESKEDYQSAVEKMANITPLNDRDSSDFVAAICAGAWVAFYSTEYAFEDYHWGRSNNPTEYAVTSKEPALRLWRKENNGTLDEQVLYDELVIKRATETAKIIAEELPQYNEECLREFIALNLQYYYGLKK